jgi:hypothetical protein
MFRILCFNSTMKFRIQGFLHGSMKIGDRTLIVYQGVFLFLYFILWIQCLSKAYFFADDFTFLKTFWQDPKLLTDGASSLNRYTTNLLFGIGTSIFSSTSVVPYSVISSLALVLGLWLIATKSDSTNIKVSSSLQIFTISLVFGGALPLMLWPSGITHTGSIFFSGLALYFHAKKDSELRRTRFILFYQNLAGISWLLVIVSNPLYIGVLFISLVKLKVFFHDRKEFTLSLGQKLILLFTNLALPLLYFLLIARPATLRNQFYSTIGIEFIAQNFQYYQSTLFWSPIIFGTYSVIFFASVFISLKNLKTSLVPFSFLVAGSITMIVVLMQGQQRLTFYLVLPAIFILTSLIVGINKEPQVVRQLMTFGLCFTTAVALTGGSRINSYFAAEPWGYKLKPLISQIERLGVKNEDIKICLKGTPEQYATFYLNFGGGSAFLLPPVSASSVIIQDGLCEPDSSKRVLIVSQFSNGFSDLSEEIITK